WFVHHRGLAIGIAAAGLGAGYTIVPLIAAQLLAHLSWQTAFAGLGAIIILPFVTNLWTARPNPNAVAARATAGMTLSEAIRTSDFAVMASSILLASAALTGV